MSRGVVDTKGRWNYIVWVDADTQAITGEIGAKAQGLLNLVKWGYSVPNSFVVSTKGYEEFAALLRKHPSDLLVKRPSEISDKSLRKRVEVLQSQMQNDLGFFALEPLTSEILLAYESLCHLDNRPDTAVAVRSSASNEDLRTRSYAGSYESYLNVQGNNSLLASIRDCWASLWKEHLLIDYAEQGVNNNVKMAVIVQQMVCADVAGVAFTMNPVTRDQSQIVINSNWGLGDSVVSGRALADMFAIDKASGEITSTRISPKEFESSCGPEGGVISRQVPPEMKHSPSLGYHQIAELASLCASIEGHFGTPVDIEWAIKDDKCYILQARPVTTL